MKYVMGIDSGGSKTLCVAASTSGEVLGVGAGRGIASTIDDVSIVMPALQEAVKSALGGAPLPALETVYVCLGGLNVRAVADVVREILRPQHVIVRRESSGDVVLNCARVWGFDVAVMAGTGSIALGIGPQDYRRVVAGWGYFIGDRGSGYAIGQQTLRHVADSLDFGSKCGRLMSALAETPLFRRCVPDPSVFTPDPVEMTYDQRLAAKEAIKKVLPALTRGEVAGLCPAVAEAARNGDAAAIEIIRQAGQHLADLAIRVIDELEMRDRSPVVVGMGGVFRVGELIWRPFADTVQNRIPGAEVRPTDFTLVCGAVIRAIQESGEEVSTQTIDTLRKSYHQWRP